MSSPTARPATPAPGAAPGHAPAVEAVRARSERRPRVGIVLGSGLGPVADAVEDATRIPYAELPGFPVSGVKGHAGVLHLGALAGVEVAVMQGRAHLYEGIEPTTLQVPMRTLRDLGAEAVLLTNAAGGLDPEVGPGRLMAISDHINLTGINPLMGPNDDAVGERFVSMGAAYDAGLRAALHRAAGAVGLDLAEGVYVAVTGPSFETPAEIRAFRTLGADAVGMSTVPEVIVARHCGLRVAGVSAIVNQAEGMSEEVLTHEGTLVAAESCARDLARLVPAFLQEL